MCLDLLGHLGSSGQGEPPLLTSGFVVADPRAAKRRRFCIEANDRLYYVERAAQARRSAMWTGRKPRRIPRNVIDHGLGE